MPRLEPRFLLVSLGNPKPYIDTLHSAGHLALLSLQRLLSNEQPPFSGKGPGKQSLAVSVGPKYTMLQSGAVMNVSGPWVFQAWKQLLGQQSTRSSQTTLVLVHDDLEAELGTVKIRSWNTSPRGHNGVKSVKKSFSGLGPEVTSQWARITIGIGRPEGRDQSTVSDYVLRKMTGREKDAIEAAAPRILECLMELEAERDAVA